MTAVIEPQHDHDSDDFEAKLSELLSGVAPVRTPTRAEIDAMFDRHDAARKVVACAQRWQALLCSSEMTWAEWMRVCDELADAVTALNALSLSARSTEPGVDAGTNYGGSALSDRQADADGPVPSEGRAS